VYDFKMALVCNINARGKRRRFIIGILLLLAAILVGIWGWREGSEIFGIFSGVLALGGGFSVFEAAAGWCAVRAMGFKTRV
jgi:hypothetical protein